MNIWNYNKKLIVDNKSQECREAHENTFDDPNSYQDWYFEQVESGLADEKNWFAPYKLASNSVYEFLMTDQTQVDSFIALASAIADHINCPLSYTVVDVEYTTDTIPDDFETGPSYKMNL